MIPAVCRFAAVDRGKKRIAVPQAHEDEEREGCGAQPSRRIEDPADDDVDVAGEPNASGTVAAVTSALPTRCMSGESSPV